MKVAAVQHDVVWEDVAATQAHLAPMIAEAAAGGARLVVLTEIYATGFSTDTDRISEPFDGPSVQFLVEQARAHDVWVCGSVPERAPDAPADEAPGNVLVLAAPDGTTYRYTKIHPFSYAHEDEHYRAGRHTVTVDVDGLRVSLFVCYDLRFADAFWTLARDTDCYVVPANWPASRREHWRALLVARAIENQAYVAGSTRCGSDPSVMHCGRSVIIDPRGNIIADAGSRPGTISARIRLDALVEYRREFPVLADLRGEFFGPP